MRPTRDTKTLVLSYTYELAGYIHWKKALELVFRGVVDTICDYENVEVRSVNEVFRLPSVIRIRHNKSRKYSIRFSRDNVYARDEGKCQYCAKAVSRETSTLDHIVPKRRGGIKSWDNMVLSCKACNIKKGDLTLEEAGMKLLKLPIQPRSVVYFLRNIIKSQNNIPKEWFKFIN